MLLVLLNTNAMIQGAGGLDLKHIGFLSNTDPDPLKITNLASQHSMFDHHEAIYLDLCVLVKYRYILCFILGIYLHVYIFAVCTRENTGEVNLIRLMNRYGTPTYKIGLSFHLKHY